MAKVITMPKLGLTMKEGKLTKWHRAEGDEVKAGEVLFDVETDKLTNEIEAQEDGFIRKLLVDEGEVVPCLKAVAIVGSKDEDISSYLDEEHKDRRLSEEENKKKRMIASPTAKKLAQKNNIDLSKVKGSGPNGRIVLEDVEKYMEAGKNKEKTTSKVGDIAKQLGINLSALNKGAKDGKNDYIDDGKEESVMDVKPGDKKVAMGQMRKVIAKRMGQSWNISPAVTFDMKVDVSNLRKFKNEIKHIHKITYTDLLVKITAKVLMEFPLLNCTVEGDHMILREYANIGIAVALDDGLIVPVIKNAHIKGLMDISKEVRELSLRARENTLSVNEATGGTFTITNLGMYGIDSFSPIINQPEVGILGVNAIVDTPVVENEKILIKPMMKLSLTADHRAVDGAVAAKFLVRVKEYLEKPEMLLL